METSSSRASSVDGAQSMEILVQGIVGIFDLEHEQHPVTPGSLVQPGQADQNSPDDSDDRRTAMVEYLKRILPILPRLWQSGSEYIDLAAEKLADGSRDTEWRIPIGDSGILDFFLEILPHCDHKRVLKAHILRLIGNSCADVDENRARALSRNAVPLLVECLQDGTISQFAILVLFNLCVDFEPAQQAASQSFLTQHLIRFLSRDDPSPSRTFLEHSYKLLGFMSTQAFEADYAPNNTALVILHLAADKDLINDAEDLLNLLKVATLYLRHQKFQRNTIENGGMTTALAIIADVYTRFDTPENSSFESFKSLREYNDRLLAEVLDFSKLILDISALPEFTADLYPLDGTLAKILYNLILSTRPHLQNCACVLLGNLARSNIACEELVHVYHIHERLIAILKSTNDTQLRFTVLSLLHILSFSPKNKHELGNSGLLDFLPNLWFLEDTQPIQYTSICLTRSLLTENWDNVRKFYRRLSRDKDSPAHTRTNLSLLLAIFSRTVNKATKLEISRLMTAILQVGSARTPEDAQKLEENKRKFYLMHPELGRPLAFMITQENSATIRCEGWSTLALLAGTVEGADCIDGVLMELGGLQALVETLRGKNILNGQPITPGFGGDLTRESWNWAQRDPANAEDLSEEDAAQMARSDRKNARAILRVLITKLGDTVDAMQLSMYEDLLGMEDS